MAVELVHFELELVNLDELTYEIAHKINLCLCMQCFKIEPVHFKVELVYFSE